MYYYKIYGLNIKTDYRLEEAVEIDETENVDISIIKDLNHDPVYDMTERDKSVKCFLYHYEKDKAWVRYPNHGAFIIRNGNEVTYKLYENYESLLINQSILCTVIPIAIVQRNEQIMIHGSGLILNDKCFVISGKSGAGKSTVTNALIDKGAKFIADDTVAISITDQVLANSAYPQQKLCLDQITDKMKEQCEMILLPEDDGVRKYAVRDKNRFSEGRKKLEALIILNPTDAVSEPVLEEMNGADKLTSLLDNLYRRDVYDCLGMGPDIFKKCMEVASKIKVYRLSRPYEGITTNEQIKLIKTVI